MMSTKVIQIRPSSVGGLPIPQGGFAMTTRRAMCIVGLIAPAAALLFTAGGAGQFDDTSMIKKNTAEFKAAWNNHDSRAIAALFARDGDLICPDGQFHSDASSVEKFFTNEYGPNGKLGKTQFDIKKDQIRFITPDVALQDWECVVTGITGSDGADAGPVINRCTVISKKEGNTWKIAAARPQAPEMKGEKAGDMPFGEKPMAPKKKE
jgi:uncharacterized protein (TIGR02246 family)